MRSVEMVIDLRKGDSALPRYLALNHLPNPDPPPILNRCGKRYDIPRRQSKDSVFDLGCVPGRD